MAEYRPDLSGTIALFLFTPTYAKANGVNKKVYSSSGELIFGTFKTYGGTEKEVNGVYSIEDTGIVEMFYDPRVKADCRIQLETGELYDIINEPENINRRNQFLRFKVKRVKGGA